MRGKHESRPMEELILQATNLVKKGTKELVLIAQDLTDYGIDIYKKRNLAELLDKLSDVQGVDWIRLQYAFPAQFPMEILDVMNAKSNICKYLDMPLQHGSTEMLKIMRRGITGERTLELVDKIREKVPGIALRTTLIAGHPGETEKEFDEMYRFVERGRFDRLGVFTYSHEENTHAHSLDDNIPEEVKQERADQIMELQQGISYELNQEKINSVYKVLFDRKENGFYVGRTEFDSPEVDNEVLVEADGIDIQIGSFRMVKIHDATDFDLYGSVVS